MGGVDLDSRGASKGPLPWYNLRTYVRYIVNVLVVRTRDYVTTPRAKVRRSYLPNTDVSRGKKNRGCQCLRIGQAPGTDGPPSGSEIHTSLLSTDRARSFAPSEKKS